MAADPYPVVIINDRYGGVYSGAKWTAFHEHEAPAAPQSDDGSAASFWLSHEDAEWIGKGDTPDEALADLVRRLHA